MFIIMFALIFGVYRRRTYRRGLGNNCVVVMDPQGPFPMQGEIIYVQNPIVGTTSQGQMVQIMEPIIVNAGPAQHAYPSLNMKSNDAVNSGDPMVQGMTLSHQQSGSHVASAPSPPN